MTLCRLACNKADNTLLDTGNRTRLLVWPRLESPTGLPCSRNHSNPEPPMPQHIARNRLQSSHPQHVIVLLACSLGSQLRAVLGHSPVVLVLRPFPRFRQAVNGRPRVAHDVQKFGAQLGRRDLWQHLVLCFAAVERRFV